MDYDYLESKIGRLSIEINELNIYILQNKKLRSLKEFIPTNDITTELNDISPENKKIKTKQHKKRNDENEVKIKEKEEEKSISIGQLCSKSDIMKVKSWAEIAEEDEKSLYKKYEQLQIEINELKFNMKKIMGYQKIGLKSKLIRFEFINNIVTWEIQERHESNGMIKIIINPIYGNIDIYQVFYYNINKNALGYKSLKDFVWFSIDFHQRLLQYPDNGNQLRYVYYNFVSIECSI